MTAEQFIQRWYPRPYNVPKMLEAYADQKIKEEREAIYAKRQKIQYMKKQDFIENGV